MLDKEKEKAVWKTYPEFPFIEANQFGEVRTKDRVVTRKNGIKCYVKGRVLKQQQTKDGYMCVRIGVNGKKVNLKVHRVVASTFIPNPDNLPGVNHKDNNPKNNAISNLEWCSHEYNIQYREKYGKACNRPVIAVNLETLEVFRFKSQMEAARYVGAKEQNVRKVIKGNLNKTHGYWFCRVDEHAIEKARVKFGIEMSEKVEKLLND